MIALKRNSRAPYHDAITRADIANLIPGISGVNEDAHTLTSTNPEKSKNLNVNLEYYFEPVGQFTVGWFRFGSFWELGVKGAF